jgi:hypothetical protein
MHDLLWILLQQAKEGQVHQAHMALPLAYFSMQVTPLI